MGGQEFCPRRLVQRQAHQVKHACSLVHPEMEAQRTKDHYLAGQNPACPRAQLVCPQMNYLDVVVFLPPSLSAWDYEGFAYDGMNDNTFEGPAKPLSVEFVLRTAERGTSDSSESD